MAQAEAEHAPALIRKQLPEVYADPVDPQAALTLHLDQWTAEMIREGLRLLVAAGGDVGNMQQDFDEFLDHARPYETDEERWPGLM